MNDGTPGLYREFYVARSFERLALFRLMREAFGVGRALYPGSFVHVTPSFVIPSVVYVDADKKAGKFFGDRSVYEFIAQRSEYKEAAGVVFYPMDYSQGIPEPEASFDLLISQYAGFVSHYCTRYLRVGGLLVANDSHGDASLAAIDGAHELVAVVAGVGEGVRLVTEGLDAYFVPRSGAEVTRERLFKEQRGVAYRKNGSDYVFRRVV